MMKRFEIARVAKCLNLRRLVAVVWMIFPFSIWKGANSCVPLLGNWLWIMVFLVDVLFDDTVLIVLHEIECYLHH